LSAFRASEIVEISTISAGTDRIGGIGSSIPKTDNHRLRWLSDVIQRNTDSWGLHAAAFQRSEVGLYPQKPPNRRRIIVLRPKHIHLEATKRTAIDSTIAPQKPTRPANRLTRHTLLLANITHCIAGNLGLGSEAGTDSAPVSSKQNPFYRPHSQLLVVLGYWEPLDKMGESVKILSPGEGIYYFIYCVPTLSATTRDINPSAPLC